jgi:hypothetical protein
MKKNILIPSMLLALLISVNANATPIPLNVNNENIVGGPWGQVTLTQMGTYEVDFSVEAFASAFISVGTNFGIQQFGFNVNTSAPLIINYPTGWSLKQDKNLDGYKMFDILEKGTGSTRKNPLTFSITSTDPISVSEFIVLNGAGYPFAVHIADFTATTATGTTKDSAWFSTVPVPEPGILILLGIAMSAIGIAYPFVRKI